MTATKRLADFICPCVTGFWLLLSAAGLFAGDGVPSREGLELFEKKVQPILAGTCYKCHSHDADKIKGGLLLDSQEAALKGGDTGPAVVPGKPEESLLIKAVRYTDRDLQMPPKGKKLSDEQIAALTEWVRLGAPRPAPVATDRLHRRRRTAEDKDWWAFQPLRRPVVPEVKNLQWSANPVDRFILARLETEELKPSPEAERRTLIRRAYFDLIGLPPGAQEVERFVSDRAPDAYEKVIDGLLHSPHYGEKWGRHWLDLVRYAESDGFKLDEYRPTAWRYRDYVIRSFNDDKPYNRFLMEQVAADELWPENPEAVVGTGYLRLTIYEYNQRNVHAQWAGIINDLTDVTGDAFLGLGMQCARCHDHKFDPILQKDYFRLRAFFAPLSPREDLPLATPQALAEYRRQLARWQEKTAAIRAQIDALEKPVRERTARAVLDKFPKEIQAIMNKPAAGRTPYEQQINDLAYRQVTYEFEKLDGKFKGEEKEKLDRLRDELDKFDEFKPKPLPTMPLVTDIGPVAPPNTIPRRGSGEDIAPGFLSLLGAAPAVITPVPESPGTTGRRAALARWLAQPDNRFTTRVMVNRIWQRHFGQGIVATPSDFGHLGEPPTHPELLDWLANYFVEHNWSVKAMHRLILTSATYRQSALTPASEVARAKDPDNRLLWRMNVRRLEAEQIRDAMLTATGELDETVGGPSVDASKPRRTVYTRWLRNSRDSLLEAFDPPDAYVSTPQRNVTTTPSQALLLINGQYTLQRAQALAQRIAHSLHAPRSSGREFAPSEIRGNQSRLTSAATSQGLRAPNFDPGNSHPENDAAAINAAYRFVLGREPSESERSHAAQFLTEQAARIAGAGLKTVAAGTEPMPGRSGSTAALFKPTGTQTRLQVPDNHLMPTYDFTVEAFVVLRSVDDGSAVRTIVSRWDGRKDQPGWSFGVTGRKSAGTPQSLVLELIGDPAEDGTGGYDAITSGLRLELDTPCYVAVSVRIGDTSETGITFYLKALTAGAGLQAARVPHKVTANHQSNLPLIIGAREPEKRVVWDGLVDDLRLSRAALKPEQLLPNREGGGDDTVGYWCFEEPNFFKDSSPNGHNIRSDIAPTGGADAKTAALIDFCHLLFNANEFLYVD
jgi:mono/diheme cytochrome c family protein